MNTSQDLKGREKGVMDNTLLLPGLQVPLLQCQDCWSAQCPLGTPAGTSEGTMGRPDGRTMWLDELFQSLPGLLILKICRGWEGKSV